jgi:hypothetical protein
VKTKLGKFSIILLLSTAMFATSAFAADKTNLQLTRPVTVNGTHLEPGSYTVSWNGAGPNVELKIMKGKKEVATAAAHLVNLNTVTSPGSMVTREENGNTVLTEISPSGKKFALAIGNESVTTAESSGK